MMKNYQSEDQRAGELRCVFEFGEKEGTSNLGAVENLNTKGGRFCNAGTFKHPYESGHSIVIFQPAAELPSRQ
jgi:hypothetical protein